MRTRQIKRKAIDNNNDSVIKQQKNASIKSKNTLRRQANTKSYTSNKISAKNTHPKKSVCDTHKLDKTKRDTKRNN